MSSSITHRIGALIFVVLLLVQASPALAQPYVRTATPADNADLQTQIEAQTSVWVAASITALVPFPPIVPITADLLAFGIELNLKHTPPVFTPPPNQTLAPLTEPAPSGCTRQAAIRSPRMEYRNWFGLNISTGAMSQSALDSAGGQWSWLGAPSIYHFNSDADVWVSHPQITNDGVQVLWLEEGKNTLIWTAATQLDPFWDVVVPTVFILGGGYKTKKQYGEQLLTRMLDRRFLGGVAPETVKAYKKLKRKEMAKSLGLFIGTAALAFPDKTPISNALKCYIDNKTKGTDVATSLCGLKPYLTAANIGSQTITIRDGHSPYITGPTAKTVEALSFGGTLFERIEADLLDEMDWGDPCDKTIYVTRTGPDFLPVGAAPTAITWRVTDVPAGVDPAEVYAAGYDSYDELTVMVTVLDTEPPLLLAPESISVESSSGPVDLSAIDLGQPQVVDYADPYVTITNDAPTVVPVDERLGITWRAEDSSNLFTEKLQWLTVKTANTNTAPTVADDTADAITAEVVEIRLDGSDVDILPGDVGGQTIDLPDRLSFEITDYPDNGKLEAPLRPFFVEDFRVSPVGRVEADGGFAPHPLGTYATGFSQTPTANHAPYLQSTICADVGTIPVDFVYQPTYVHVTDAGDYFIRDSMWECATGGSASAIRRARISLWDEDRQFIDAYVPPDPQGFSNNSNNCYFTQFDVSANGDLVWGQGCIYTFGGSASDHIYLRPQHQPDGTLTDIALRTVRRFIASEAETVMGWRIRSVLEDLANNIVYVNNSRGVGIYKADDYTLLGFLEIDGEDCFFGGPVGLRDESPGRLDCTDSPYNWSFGTNCIVTPALCGAFVMKSDSEGNLYIVEQAQHRIHKFKPTTLDDNDELVLGDYVGWMGRCSTNVPPYSGCDEAREVTRGFACDDQKCLRDTVTSGSEPSQFNRPGSLVIDPKDNLYVADVENNRVQRFGSDGTFAGQAQAEDPAATEARPGFLLGRIDKPTAISVNSSTLFIIEVANSLDNFMQSFKTLPFHPIEAASGDPGDADADGYVDNSVIVKYVSEFNFPGGLGSPQGSDTFSYKVNDGLVDSNEATVTVNVERAYRPPERLARRCYDSSDKSNEVPCDVNEDAGIYIELIAADPDGIVGFDGLDTLTYTLLEATSNGSLIEQSSDAASALYYYEPEPDYFGPDSFSYGVNDGRDSVDSDSLSINVLPVPDPPKIFLDPASIAGRGFPTTISASFSDPDEPNEAVPTLSIQWADGDVEQQGEIVENPAGSGMYEATGPLLQVFAPGASAPGFIAANHTYLDAIDDGFMLVCLEHAPDAQDNTTTCEPNDVVVIETASLAVGMTASTHTPVADEVIDFQVQAVNQQPDGWAGFEILDTEVTVDLPAGVTLGTFPTSCAANGEMSQLSCAIGALVPGSQVDIDFTASVADDAFPELIKTVTARGSHNVANFPSEAEAQVDLLVDWLDTDGDGMPDAWEERYGLDPDTPDGELDTDGGLLINLDEYANSTDPTIQDTDGDGLTDYEEVEGGTDPLVDSVAPVFTAPGDVTVISAGALTNVDFGNVFGVDALDGDLPASNDDPGPYAPGRHVIEWFVTDNAGNSTSDTQVVDIIPLVNFGVDQVVGEGGQAEVLVQLNGSAIEYPVLVDYMVSGDAANPEDHNAADGTVVIESGTAGSIVVDIVDDGVFENPETIALTMAGTVNAEPGSGSSHNITIDHDNIRPRARIVVSQRGHRARVISTNRGAVTVAASVRDPNVLDTHTYDWSASDPSLVDPLNATSDTYTIDPSGLTPGVYRLTVDVADDGVPMGMVTRSTLIRVVQSFRPRSHVRDRDGDGIVDFDEGEGDIDGDGIADIDDANNLPNQLLYSEDGRVLETETGLGIRLGDLAFILDRLAGLSESDVGEDPGYVYFNDIADFEVTEVDSGDTADVVVPLRSQLSDESVYRKNVMGQWSDFVEDENNALSSAPGTNGACPEPGSVSYLPGLTAGNQCVQLSLEDGGPNDSDVTPNNVIADPGGVAQPVGVTLQLITASSKLVSAGSDDNVVFEMLLSSDSGEVELRSMTIQASGTGNDQQIRDVALVVDANSNGIVDVGEETIANGTYDSDDGMLTLVVPAPYAIPAGQTNLLVTYDL